jgi:uncharacterized protein involved in exopolysaccharide biosynthesis
MVPQVNNSSAKLGSLSSLASLAGFNLDLGSGGGDISPVLYPKIVNSISFRMEIMNTEYEFEELDHPVTLFDYYVNTYKPGLFGILKKYTIGLPGIILKAIRGESAEINTSNSKSIRLTREQDEVIGIIADNLTLLVNDKEGYLSLSSKFHQPWLSAQIAQKARDLLQEYITNFKIEKALAQLSFIESRHSEKKAEFETAQSKLASYRDANRNISSSIARTHEEKLENEYQLSFEVYSELSKQLENARITVKEDTPVFSVIEEVVVPFEKTKPNRPLIIIIWVMIGSFVGSVILLFKRLSTIKMLEV